MREGDLIPQPRTLGGGEIMGSQKGEAKSEALGVFPSQCN